MSFLNRNIFRHLMNTKTFSSPVWISIEIFLLLTLRFSFNFLTEIRTSNNYFCPYVSLQILKCRFIYILFSFTISNYKISVFWKVCQINNYGVYIISLICFFMYIMEKWVIDQSVIVFINNTQIAYVYDNTVALNLFQHTPPKHF